MKEKAKRVEHTSGSQRASSSWWADDRKDKRGKQRDGRDTAGQLGSLLLALSHRDKSCLFIGLSVCQPSFLLSEGRPHSPRHEAQVQMGL